MASLDVKQIFQELVVPELREIKAEIKVLQTEIKRLDEKIDLQGARLEEKIEAQGARLDQKIEAQGTKLDQKIEAQGARLDQKIEALHNEMRTEFRRLDEKIDLTLHVQERLVSLETRMSAYEARN